MITLPGGTVQFTAGVQLQNTDPVDGWSLSVRTSPAFQCSIVGATVAGTLGDLDINPPGMRDSTDCGQGSGGSLDPEGGASYISLAEFDELTPAPLFIRGDVDWDYELLLTDAISILHSLYLSPKPLSCPDAADVNDDGEVNISDVVGVLGCLFMGSYAPPPPIAHIDADPTSDGIDC